MSKRRALGVLVLALAAGASCAHQVGKEASQGFVQGLQQARADNPDARPVRSASESAVEGTLAALEDPKQQEILRSVIAAAATQAAASTITALNDPQQRQQLAQLMSTIATQAFSTALASGLEASSGARGPAAQLAGDMARAATKDAMAEVTAGLNADLEQLFPGCSGPDVAACRRQHLRALTREAGAGFTAGVMDSIRWLGLLVAGFVGLLIGLVLHWLWSQRQHHPNGPLVSINGGRGLREAHGTRGAP
jgi:hypothetical protein